MQTLDIANVMSEMTAAFESTTRLYDITVGGISGLVVESFTGKEMLGEGFEFRVLCLSTDAGVDVAGLLGKQAVLSMRTSEGGTTKRSGYVREAAGLGADGGLARYELVLVPSWWQLTQRRNNRLFVERTVAQIIEEVLGAYTARLDWRFSDEVAGFLEGARPRSLCCQYRESDHDFLARLLAEEGLGLRIEETEGEAGGDAPAHRVIVFADSTALPQDASSASGVGGSSATSGLRYHRADALEEQDSITAFGPLRRIQARATSLITWDYANKRPLVASLSALTPAGAAPAIEQLDTASAYAAADSADAERYVRLMREAQEASEHRQIGASNVRTLRPGTWFTLTEAQHTGFASPDNPARYLVLEVHHAGLNNLPRPVAESAAALRAAHARSQDDLDATWRTGLALSATQVDATRDDPDAADLLAAAQARGYANRFITQALTTPWRPTRLDSTGTRLQAAPRLEGLQVATVCGPDGSTQPQGNDELYTDGHGRIRLKFGWDSAQRVTPWIRVARRYAGAGQGWQAIPRIGQEVLVRFLEGDIDRPIVVGTVYNGQGEAGTPPTPNGQSLKTTDPSAYTQARDQRPSAQGNAVAGASPAWHGASPDAAGHRNPAALSGLKSAEFGAASGQAQGHNQLVFDDTDQQLRIQLASTQAATQLNLGHLIHQADNARGSLRGLGLELRTDAQGAIRAHQGLLLTSYAPTTAYGMPTHPAGDNAAGIALARQAQQLAQTLSDAARDHQSVPIAAYTGAQQATTSTLDGEAAFVPAMVTSLKGMVDREDHGLAQDDAGNKRIATEKTKLPHSADALIAASAKAGLGLAAAQHLHLAAGEVVHLSSGGDTDIAIGGQGRVHTGQAIGLTAGAVKPAPDGIGIQAIAASGPIKVQAQAANIQIAAKQDVKVQSQSAHIDWAAAKSITLATAGGASITIAGGNITVQCPGTITVHASNKSFTGPVRQGYALPQMPKSAMKPTKRKFDLMLTATPGKNGTPLSNLDWRIVRLGASQRDRVIVQGRTDDQGKLALTSMQELRLSVAVAKWPSDLTLLAPGVQRKLDLYSEQPDWTDQQKNLHALAALDFSDRPAHALDSDERVAELRRAAQASGQSLSYNFNQDMQ